MLKKSILSGLICLFLAGSVFAQTEKPLPADKVMEAAYAKSKETGKNVFLIFHATWCTWCKKLDKAMQSEQLQKIFDDNFIIVHLDVMERGEKIAQFENPGGKELMDKLGGAKSGVPFFAFISADGKSLGDSNVMPGNQNIGYPGTIKEIAEFMGLIKIGAPKISKEQFKTMLLYFIENSPGLM
jgi:thioredoxin-related protein